MSLVIPIFIPHRGCPHQCLFCNQRSITGHDQSDLSVKEEITQTVEEWLGRSGEQREVQVAFYGGSFTCLARQEQVDMLSSVQPFIDSGRVGSIRLSTRPDCVDPEICSLLREFGVTTVELGVQSLDDDVLERSRRGHTTRQSRNALKMLQGAGMEAGVQLMVGLPFETTVSFLRGIDEVVRLKPDFIRLYPVLVVKNSGLEDLYNRGLFQPLSLEKAVALTAKGYKRFELEGIPVIRMGLQPSEDLEKSIIAGPYHPAFGELVKSRIWLGRIRRTLAALLPGQKAQICVSHRDLSAVIGMKKQNIRRLTELGFGDRFTLVADKCMERGNIRYDFSK
ncbi:MAG: radical SAM protein [Deltaproteobacteria bacterium]|nr:radical SAM protein [Deltaproteobacteria bacterium]